MRLNSIQGFGSSSGKLKPINLDSGAVAEHECGHAVYKENMRLLVDEGLIGPNYRNFARASDHRHQAMLNILQQQELELRIAATTDPVQRAALERELDGVKGRASALARNWDAIEASLNGLPLDFHTEYEELFSDLLVIARHNDPGIIARTVPNDLMFAPHARNAAVPKPPEGWYADVPQRQDQDLHHVLGPALHHAWDCYMRTATNDAERARILRRIFLAIADEIDERARNRELRNLSAEEKNRRLMRRMDLRMASAQNIQ
jgi:hypothetical protein